MNIAIIYGGKSSEHEVSLSSAASIVRAINDVHTLYLIGIDRKGNWYLQPSSMLDDAKKHDSAPLSIEKNEDARVFIIPGGGCTNGIHTKTGPLAVDVVFPVMHGRFGEDGTIQGLFEMADIPYVGGGVLASSLAMDKQKTKIIWQHEQLPVVPFLCIKKTQWDTASFRSAFITKAEKELKYPLFIKPCCLGSSVGAAKALNQEVLIKSIEEAFIWDDKILVESCIDAREIECSVTGNDDITVYTPGEVISAHEFYDYNAKYIDPVGAQLKIPADIDDEQRRTIRMIARKAYEVLDLTGLARVDFFIDRKNNNIYLNEVNTIPGFTAISMFPKMCIASGLPYEELIMRLLTLAIERFNTNRRIKTS